jgi:Phosphotransferase enzyme family
VPADHGRVVDGEVARSIAAATLGRDPGPMAMVGSSSHDVFVSSEVVVKIIDAQEHSRLDREVVLAPHLPLGLTSPLLASGDFRLGDRDVRFACYLRMPGVSPGMGLPGVDTVTACTLAEEALERLDGMHGWIPMGRIEQTLKEPLDHGGFVGQVDLFAALECLKERDRLNIVGSHLLDGLAGIAARAPLRAMASIPVHADCHWGNWLASDGRVTALLDFEWARYGEPVDDWFFLIRFSGPHMEAVLDVISGVTAQSKDLLRAECEIREAAYLVSDLCQALEGSDTSSPMTENRLRATEELVVGRYWWRHAD